MAYTQFKGIKRVLSSNTAYNNLENHGDFLYFVRETTTALEGDIWFQGIHYGHFGANDLTAIETALEGFLPGDTGYTNQTVKEYIDNLIGGKDASVTGESADGRVRIQVDEADGALTAATVTINDIASASALTQEISDREDADQAINAELDAVESSLGFNGTAYTQSQKEYISGNTVAEDIHLLDAAMDANNDAIIHLDEKIENEITARTEAIENAIEALDYSGVTVDGRAIVNVTETNGVITATQGDIEAEHVTIEDAGELFTATNVEDALAELAGKVNANEVESSDDSIIVTPTSGKTDLAVRVDGTTIVKNNDGSLKADLELVALTSEEISALQDPNVREAYKLIAHGDQNRTAISSVVKVWKDSSLYRAYLGHMDDEITSVSDPTVVPGSGDTALCFIYHLENGNYELVPVNLTEFIEDSEFADGLEVTNHIVRVKIDPNSESVTTGDSATAPVLSVGPDGVKVDNIQAAIDYAVAQAAAGVDADVTGTSSDGKVTVEVVQVDTEIARVVVTTDDIASASDLADEVAARESGDTGIMESLTDTAATLTNMIEELGSGLTEEAEAREAADNDLYDAITAETHARQEEDNALDARLDAIEAAYLTGATVNGVDATVADNHATVTIDAGGIEIGRDLTGTTVNPASDDTVDDVLQDIIDALDNQHSAAYTGITSTGNTLSVTDNQDDLGQNVEFLKETATETTVANGHLELEQNSNHEWYGVMYWIDEETSE